MGLIIMKLLSVTALLCLFVVVTANGNGRINCDRPCPMNLDPVCASNGETYSNWCAYENSLCGVPSAKAYEVVHSGPCKPKASTLDIKLAKEIASTMDIKLNRGKILCERPCPMIYLPVCGTNGVTYSSECHFENALCGHPSKDAFTVAHKGPCKAKPQTMDKRSGKIMCEQACPMIHMPVCATNGVTYSSECHFENALCGIPTKQAFTIAHKGACKPKAETMDKRGGGKIMCEQPCPFIFDPVCGSNGVTYDNQCAFDNALCGVSSKRAFKMAHKGPCKEIN